MSPNRPQDRTKGALFGCYIHTLGRLLEQRLEEAAQPLPLAEGSLPSRRPSLRAMRPSTRLRGAADVRPAPRRRRRPAVLAAVRRPPRHLERDEPIGSQDRVELLLQRRRPAPPCCMEKRVGSGFDEAEEGGAIWPKGCSK